MQRKSCQYANDIYALTGYGATSAGEQLGRAIKDMRRLTELDEELADAAGILEDADGLLSDFNREISEYMKDMEFDEGQFREMESRLDQINSLKGKIRKFHFPDFGKPCSFRERI